MHFSGIPMNLLISHSATSELDFYESIIMLSAEYLGITLKCNYISKGRSDKLHLILEFVYDINSITEV